MRHAYPVGGQGRIRREPSQRGFVYATAVAEATAKRSALTYVVSTFGGSPADAATASLGMSPALSERELDDVERLIAKAHEERHP